MRRPDVLIECGTPGGKDMLAAEPRAVIEVLSPSTVNFDRVTKLPEYMTVPSPQAILLVDTEKPQVVVYGRAGAEWANEDVVGLEGTIDRLGVAAAISMGKLYEGVEFGGGVRARSQVSR